MRLRGLQVHERVMGIQRVTFYSVMSMLEISLKQYAVENPSQIGDTAKKVDGGKKVYLYGILKDVKKPVSYRSKNLVAGYY